MDFGWLRGSETPLEGKLPYGSSIEYLRIECLGTSDVEFVGDKLYSYSVDTWHIPYPVRVRRHHSVVDRGPLVVLGRDRGGRRIGRTDPFHGAFYQGSASFPAAYS